MSRGRRFFKSFRITGFIPIIVASIGLGMLLSIIIPFWIWIAGVGIGLIIFAWLSLNRW